MDGKFDVTRAGAPCGVVMLAQNGLMQEVNYSGNAPDSENVYRLAAVCSGRYVLLGVPVPDKSGALSLVKSLSKSSVRELGFALPNSFELVLPDEEYAGLDSDDNEPIEFDTDSKNENIEKKPNIPEPPKEPEQQPILQTEPKLKTEQKHESKPELLSEPRQNPHPEQNSVQKPKPEPKLEQKLETKPTPQPVQKSEIKAPNPQKESVKRHNMREQNAIMRSAQAPNQVKADSAELNMQSNPEIPAIRADGWRPVANPSVMFAENGALSSANEIRGALVREEGEFIYLAIPVSEKEPFPLMSAFCLGEPQTINNDEYLVFKLKNGAFTA